MKHSVEHVVKSIPKTLWGETRLIVVLDGFNSRKFSLLDPVHQLPWTTTFVRNFLDFVIEERSLSILDCRFERFPIFAASFRLVCEQGTSAKFRPPLLGVFGVSGLLSVFSPHLIDNYTKLVDNWLEIVNGFNMGCVQLAEVWDNVFDEFGFMLVFWGLGLGWGKQLCERSE